MNKDFLFRLARPDEDSRILDLYKASFGRALPAYWWKWYSRQCPTGLDRTTVIEDLTTGKLIASLSYLPIQIRYNFIDVRASLATNGNTHPDYQGKGLFTSIGHYALSQEKNFGSSISLGMPNPKAYPGHMKVGWDVFFELPFLVKYKLKDQTHKCREVKIVDQRFDKFFNQIVMRYSFIVLKDYNFMNWRIANRPDKRYKIFVYEENGTIKGYVVLKKFDDNGYYKTHIMDIQALTENALKELIAAAESFAYGRNELNMWTNPDNPYHSFFLELGFKEKESQDLLIIHFNDGKKRIADEGPKWFCFADNDVY